MANVAENIIVKNFDDSEFVCRDIAETLGISEVYLRLIFKNEYGTSPGQYMLKVRMSEAWDLLADGISVSEVAGRVGYCDIFRFSKHRNDRSDAECRNFAVSNACFDRQFGKPSGYFPAEIHFFPYTLSGSNILSPTSLQEPSASTLV